MVRTLLFQVMDTVKSITEQGPTEELMTEFDCLFDAYVDEIEDDATKAYIEFMKDCKPLDEIEKIPFEIYRNALRYVTLKYYEIDEDTNTICSDTLPSLDEWERTHTNDFSGLSDTTVRDQVWELANKIALGALQK